MLAPITATAQNRDDDHQRESRDYRDHNDYRDQRDHRDYRDHNYRRDHDDVRVNRRHRVTRYHRTRNNDSRWDDARRNNDSRWDDARRNDWLSHHRQETKNEWRNIAIGAGALGALGLLQHDNTLAVLGGAGALYSLNRYEQDRRSQNSANRLRAEYFSHPYFYRDGVRYDRHEVNRNGQRYYRFTRH
jgi:hypothetical protein